MKKIHSFFSHNGNRRTTVNPDGQPTVNRRSRLTSVLCLTLLLLTLGVGNVWGYTTYYLKSDNTTWTKSDNRWGFNNDGTTTTYMAKNAKFKLWRTDWGENGWFGVGDTDGGNTLKAGDGGLQFVQYKQNVKYNGPSGMVCFHMDQTNNQNDAPWVWITRPTFYLKHNWGGGSWIWQALTDNEDGTYQLTNNYGGTTFNYGDNGSDAGSGWAGEQTATVIGSPTTGDRCEFKWNSADKSLTITKLCGLTYDGNGRNGGTAVPTALSDQKAGSTITLSSVAMTKTGYTLTGWNTAADGSGTHYALGASFTFSNKTNTLYAEWTQTITVDANTGDDAGSMSIYFNAGSLKTFTAASKTDWVLDSYWTTSDESGVKVINYDGENATLVSNVSGYTNSSGKWTRAAATTLYAHWKQTYRVTYNANYPANATSTGGSVPTDATEYENGATVTVKTNSGSLTAGGYTFDGWQTTAGGGTHYATGATFSISNNTPLYAKWTENLTSVTLAASPSGKGSFTIGGSPATSTTAGVETKPTVTAVPITGYFLTGTIWSANNSYISLSADNTASTTITGCGTASTSSTLTATFTEKYLLCGSVNAVGNAAGGMRGWTTSGDNNAYSSVTYDGNTITIVANLTNAGTQYKCKIYDVQYSAWKGQTGSGSMSSGDQWTWDGTNDVYFTTTVAGNYTFTIDISGSSPSVRITYPGEPEYSATLSVHSSGHGSVSPSAGSITLRPVSTTTITATPEVGYRFKRWNVSGVTCSSTTSATATFTASAAGGTIEAEFTNDEVIYFDAGNIENEWGDEVYVTFLSTNFEWNDGDGQDGALIVKNWVDNALRCVRMNRIPNTRIFYLDYSNLSGHGSVTQYVFFTSKYFSIPGSGFYRLYEMAAVTRGDYNKTSGNNMCVAENFREKDKNKTGYYCGYWMNYNDTKAGINLRIYGGSGDITSGNGDFTLSAAGSRTYTATVTLSANTTYSMELQGYNSTYYKNSGTMTSTNCSGWSYVDRQATVGRITTTAGGEYKFTLNCADKLYLTADYPLAVGDYRIVYQGKVKDGGSTTSHPSQVIRQLAGGATERKDTVGFYVTGDWSLKLQKCSSIDPTITWEDACGSSTLGKSAFNLDSKTGVYTFPLTLTSTGGSCDQITVGTPIPYTGNYYIRTDVADGGWEAYKRASDNRMIFSEYARDHSGYDYYHCHWTPTNTNVKFTIANDYSACITDTIDGDTYVPKNGANQGKLPYQASVRFMYNSATNAISRAYLNGSSEEGENTFLWLEGADKDGSEPKIFTSDGSVLTSNTIKMQDKNNWIYQLDIKANEEARVRLISNYRFNNNDHFQYFKGSEGTWGTETTEEIIGGSYDPDVKLDLRIIYDFKTNRLLSAWLVPETGPVASAAINTDVMILKQNQSTARQITFSLGDELTDVDTVYTAIQLDKNFLTGNEASVYEKQFYWVSFPYRVKLNDVFGSIGNYGADWIMQRYNGKKRALKGYWADSESNWEFMDRSETLNPYEGYVLTLDLGEFTSTSEKWKNNVAYLTLYFPSDGVVGNIKQTDVRVSYNQTGYVCTITRDNRNIKDSYWHCIGSPSFANNTNGSWKSHNGSDEQWTTDNLPFLYQWDSSNNTLRPVSAISGFDFAPLTGYMVQYSGSSLDWTAAVTPSVASAPRRARNAVRAQEFRVELVQNEKTLDQTFIRLSDEEEVTANFEFNYDLCKELNKNTANIYSLIGDIQVAGNCLPVSEETTVVPLGVVIAADGEYTFTLPDGSDGIGVTLVDMQNGTQTNLAAGIDYTVSLPAGTYDSRFLLEISPVQNIPTGIDEVPSDQVPNTHTRKVMIDGVLYIVRDGKIYDARGMLIQ